MKHRLYVGAALTNNLAARVGHISLNAEQSHYLTNVLRLKPGGRLTCFDGEGLEQAAELVFPSISSSVSKSGRGSAKGASLELRNRPAQVPPSSRIVHLAMGILKGSAMDLVVQKATELGVTDFWPLYTDHCDQAKRALNDKRYEHWQKIMISACEQSGRAWLPQIHRHRAVQDFLTPMTQHSPRPHLAFFDLPQEDADASSTLQVPQTSAQSVALMIGPEGGWSAAERGLLNTHAQAYTLGRYTLRAETVPMVALAALYQSWGWPD